MKYGFGIDVGGTTVKLAYFDETGKMLDKWEIPTDTRDQGCRILADVGASVCGYLNEKKISREDLLGIGIGIPGPVDNQGVVNKCVNLGWREVNVPAELGKITGLPVFAGNDANVAALGESWQGGAKGCQNMVLVTLGTGVGGGVVINGKVIHGVHGAGGEIGHITLNPFEKEACGCGNHGCTEQYCSATGIVRLARQCLDMSSVDSVLRHIEPLTCKDVMDAAKAGDHVAEEAMERVFRYMGQFLAIISCIVDPEVIAFGGGVSKAGDYLLKGAREYFNKYIFHAARNIRFVLTELGNDAGAYGAFKLVLNAAEEQ